MDSKQKAVASFDIIRAAVVRICLLVHMLFSIWAASCVVGKNEVWVLAIFAGVLLAEGIYNAVKRRGREPKWFSFCIFIFLLAVVPTIWMLNLDMIECLATENSNRTLCNGLREHSYVCSLVSVKDIFDRKPMVYTLEEIMLLMLIIGRWLLPRGSVSLDQHSQLLFIYFGLSFDMLDLFILFEEQAVLDKPEMKYVILVIWTVSLFQFTLVKTALKRRKPKLDPNSANDHPITRTLNRCCMSEIWTISSTVLMHDGPYLILRLHCLIGLRILSYNLLFFTVKNALIILLDVYRFFVLLLKCKDNVDENDGRSVDLSVHSIPRHNSSEKDLKYRSNDSLSGANRNNNNFYSNGSDGYAPNNRQKSGFHRSKQSLDSTGMSSQDFNFVSNV
ncbi:hypothetical protein HELRODRAFT_113091 [Helobdella robusta]|uniref:Transmembrane protein 26 n=1 Tax=Helobdella robusta TaxID=6412 RepID=T1EFQ1_HELRO|nr:hypothetical protein HELRODRAFT_113091 [Helobdella robusta]ESO00538.1 hypothetical protein HELRODRAFT_113091 [Helobdella robusta]